MVDPREEFMKLAAAEVEKLLSSSLLQRICRKLEDPRYVALEVMLLFSVLLPYFYVSGALKIPYVPGALAFLLLSFVLFVSTAVAMPLNLLLSILCRYSAMRKLRSGKAIEVFPRVLLAVKEFFEKVFGSKAEIVKCPSADEICRMMFDGYISRAAHGPRTFALKIKDVHVFESDFFEGSIGRFLIFSKEMGHLNGRTLLITVTHKLVIKEVTPNRAPLLPYLGEILGELRDLATLVSTSHAIKVRVSDGILQMAIADPLPYEERWIDAYRRVLKCLENLPYFLHSYFQRLRKGHLA